MRRVRVRWVRVAALAGLLLVVATMGWVIIGQDDPWRERPRREAVPQDTGQRRPTCHSNRSLHEVILDLLDYDLGATFHAAVYNALVWPYVATQSEAASSPFGGSMHETWTPFVAPEMGRNATQGGVHPLQRTTAGRLRLLHQLTSIGIGRLARDRDVERLVEEQRHLVVPLIRRFLRDLVSRFVTQLQTIIDLDETGLRARISAARPWIDFRVEDDPLIRVLAHVAHNDTEADVQRLLTSWRTLPLLSHRSHRHVPCGSFGRSFVLEYHRLGYAATEPKSAKLWNALRPTSSCTSVVRSCEDPEGGCRFLCNPDYLIDALPTHGKSSPYYHRIIGVGSNNEWGWEEGLWRLFHRRNATAQQGNQIGSLTTLDCTVSEFQPSFVLQEELRGFRVAPYCVDQSAHEENFTATAGHVGQFITLAELKSLVLRAESRGSESTVERVAAVSPPLPRDVTVAAPSSLYFDELTLLKLDVEGFEHPVLSSWAQRDAREFVGEAQRQTFELELLRASDAAAAAAPPPIRSSDSRGTPSCSHLQNANSPGSSFFRTSMLQLEIHEPVVDDTGGGRQPQPAVVLAALQLQRLVLYLTSLGFMPVAGERSGMVGSCCSEFLFVHYRYFVRSELWIAAQ